MKTRIASIAVAAAVATMAPSSPSGAAPGDILRTQPLTLTCTGRPRGLAFDGRTLYFNVSLTPMGTIFKMNAATGSDEGSFVVTRDGSPIPIAGLAYDWNRRMLWVGGAGELYLVSPATGVVSRSFSVISNGSIAVAHDPWTDLVCESDGGSDGSTCWFADGYLHGGIGVRGEYGLTHDGLDLWLFTVNNVPPPGPPGNGILYPERDDGGPDYTRALDLPGENYNDIAFDCVTFPVDAIWLLRNDACEAIAVEVDSPPPCLGPGNYLLRTVPPEDPRTWKSKLPLTIETADLAFRVDSPLDWTDPWIVPDPFRPIVYYRLMGPGDTLLGNVLRAYKDPNRTDVRLTE